MKLVRFVVPAVISSLFVVACGSSDSDGGSSQGSGGSTLSGGPIGSGGSATGSGGSGSGVGGSGTGVGSGGSGTGVGGGSSTGGPGPGASCEGNFTLGKNVVTSGSTQTFGQACNGSVPTNCPDGTWINLVDTKECICLAMCSSLSLKVGDACNGDGSVQCQSVQATNANANSANVCVPKKWNLCTKGGTGTGSGGSSQGTGGSTSSGGGSSSGGSPQGGGPTCKPKGGDCFDDAECCSGTCDFDACK